MKQKLLTTIMLMMLAIAFLGIFVKIEPAHAVSTVDSNGKDNTLTTIGMCFQKKTLWIPSTSRWWAWYYNSANNFGWKTSTDGSSWSSFTTLYANVGSHQFDFWYDSISDKICVARAVSYRQGTPNSNGTITWDFDWVSASSGSYPRVLKDSSGYPWISYNTVISDVYYLEVVKASTTSGSSWGSPTSLWTDGDWLVGRVPIIIIVPLTGGKLLAISSIRYSTIESRLYNGASWESAVSTSFNPEWTYHLDAVADGDNVHLAFLQATSLDIVYAKYTYGSGWGSAETVQASTIFQSHPSITLISTDNVRVFFFESQSSIAYRDRVSGSWQTAVYISQAESGMTCMSSSYMAFSSKFSVLWNSGYPTANDIMFEGFTTPIMVSIVKPENVTYTSSTIPVEITASDGTIDQIWYNCKNGTAWIYGSNQTYTSPTDMTGFVNGTYEFYAWANNTEGSSDSDQVWFTVEIPPTENPVNFYASPSGVGSVGFTIDGISHNTPHSENLIEGSHTFIRSQATKTISSTIIYGFEKWMVTNSSGTFNFTSASITLDIETATNFTLVYSTIQINIASSPEIHAGFKVDGTYSFVTPKTLYRNKGSHTFLCTTFQYYPNSSYVYTFDHWLVNGTDEYGSLSITLSFTDDTNLAMIYVGTTIPTPFPYIYARGALNATWYMRSDDHTVHSQLGYKLLTENTQTPTFDLRTETGTHNVSYGVRVWAIDFFGHLYELTSGSPIGVVTKSDAGGTMLVGYWNCPAYSSMIDSIMVKVYQRFDEEAWSLRRIFITKTDLLIRLPASTWTLRYYVIRAVGSTNSTFGFGSYTIYNSRINLQYYKASPWDVALARLWQRDFVKFMFTPWTYWLGDLFWTVLLFGCIVMAYLRTGSLKPVLGLLWILGGSGSILWALIPATALHVAVLMLAVAMAITYFRLVYK
jgi:hypothetical protein